jgi:hypothetical protein
MSTFRAVSFLAAIACSAFAIAKAPSQAELTERDSVIREILKDFWGNARDIHGRPIQPTSAEDRRTVPISRAAAYRAIEAGNISGLAQWCGLEWEPHYFALTKAARKMKMVDKQVAFISVLHGSGQGVFVRGQSGQTCTAYNRERAAALMAESTRKGLPSDAKQTW